MDLYAALSLEPVAGRDQPAVWVRRLIIFEKIAPEPIVIREVHLSRGLNIVWAEESENEDTAAAITGHSAGKTSFCRLLRYVLGERTYGTKANMALIENAFPGGYVGAEVFVHGKQWAVIRPIGKGRSSYLHADGTIEDAIADRSVSATLEDYPEKLGLNALLNDLETGAVVRTGQKIEWAHVLAWCTRDQEARFQNCHEWRSPRSESDWPAFRAAKTDALFVMRALLGLFLPDELKAEERLGEFLRKHEELEKRLAELKREPEFRVNLYEHQLRTGLRVTLPDEPDIESRPLRWDQLAPDLDRLTDGAVQGLHSEISEVQSQIDDLQRQADAIGAELFRKRDEYAAVAAAFGLDNSALAELDAGIGMRAEQRNQIDEHKDRLCPFGGVLIGECSYVIERQASLKITQLQDAATLEQAEAKRRDAERNLDAQQRLLESEIKRHQSARSALRTKRDALQRAIDGKREQAHDLIAARRNLIIWTNNRSAPGAFKQLDDCQRYLNENEASIAELNADLARLVQQHDISRRLLASIFSGAVRAILSSGAYNGQVVFQDRELGFHVVHGGTMSGEAVETLSILLADVACMVYNTVSDRARLPGFLLHDSPREADLGLCLYRSFMRLLAALQAHFGSVDKCPFQYIITTTTPPPDALKEGFVKLSLNATISEKLLFGRVMSASNGAALFNGEQ